MNVDFVPYCFQNKSRHKKNLSLIVRLWVSKRVMNSDPFVPSSSSLLVCCSTPLPLHLSLWLLEMFKFEVPSLTVGTLDTLMTLSDDLVKTDQVVEQTVRKIEKTTQELFDRKSSDLSVGGKFVHGRIFLLALVSAVLLQY